jgi:hypothetical protein
VSTGANPFCGPGSGVWMHLRGHFYVTPLFSHNRNAFATLLMIFGILSER